MKPRALLILALCGILLPLATQALTIIPTRPPPDAPLDKLPSANMVAKYERYSPNLDEWVAVSKTDGETVLTCLADFETFERWDRKQPFPEFLGLRVKTPVSSPLRLRYIHTGGNTNTLYLGVGGEYLEGYASGYNAPAYLAIPGAERKTLSQLFNAWREADLKQISSQPLPCQFRVGSFKGGDTLSGIARLFYGDATKWPIIHEANKDAIKNPDRITHGATITIPKPKD